MEGAKRNYLKKKKTLLCVVHNSYRHQMKCQDFCKCFVRKISLVPMIFHASTL